MTAATGSTCSTWSSSPARSACAKPEREIFELTLDRLGLPAAECVFIDDMAHNVAAAGQAGLAGIVHRTFDETASELETLFPGAGWIHRRH